MQKLMSFVSLVLLCSGCETATDLEYADPAAPAAATTTTQNTDGTTTTTSVSTSVGGFVFENAVWGGPSYAGATTEDMALSSADVDGSYIHFNFSMNNSWPKSDGHQAVVCMFMLQSDGSWYGGKFDWIEPGGQALKLTENIDAGYGAFGSNRPYSGQTVVFVWVSIDNVHRSTPALTTWD